MGDLVRNMIVCGLVSGTQPLTIMGLLLVTTTDRPRACGWAYLAGCFTVETAVLLAANLVLGGTVEADSTSGRVLIGLRLAIGAALVVFGLLLRRPAKKPQPEVPKSLTRLQTLTPLKAFVAGTLLADWQGPALASLAVASANVGLSARLGSALLYSLIASGIPIAVFLIINHSARAHDKVDNGTTWVMKNRRPLASWIALGAGVMVLGDALLTWTATS
jgi:hypothetical protein